MKVFLLFCHPNSTSFNGALRDAAVDELKKQGHEVTTSDLYQMNFDPVLRFSEDLQTDDVILNEQKKVTDAELIIIQAPYWKNGLPAMAKGWLDRVLTPGFSHEMGPDKKFDEALTHSRGYLRGRRVLLSMTAGGPESWYTSRGFKGDLRIILWPILKMLAECGFSLLRPSNVFGMDVMDRATGEERLLEYRGRLRLVTEEAPLYFPDKDEVVKKGKEDMAPTVGQHFGKPIPEGWF